MISLYSGTPGSGKSLDVAGVIYEGYKIDNKNFILNFEYDFDRIKRLKRKTSVGVCLDNSQLTIEYLVDFAEKNHKKDRAGRMIEGQTVIVIDEAQILFNSRSWQSFRRNDWITFFTQHRKLGYDVILVSQFDRLLDRQIRALIEYDVKHKNAANYKLAGKILGFLTGNKIFVAVTYWYGQKEKCNARFFIGRKKIYTLYNSYKMFADGVQKQQQKKAGGLNGFGKKEDL